MTSRNGATRLEVFALEPCAAQVVVRSDATDAVHVGWDGGETTIPLADGVGATVLQRLEPDTLYPLTADGRSAGELRTLAPPPGRLLGRFATVSDLHIGETGFGHGPRLHLSADPARAHPVICLQAALAEIERWGAEALVVKGDVSHDSRTREYDIAGPMLARYPQPVHVIPGNHDGGNHRHDDAGEGLARHGLALHRATTALHLGGLDVFLANTVHSGHEHGFAPAHDDPLFGLLQRSEAALVVLHHQLMTTRLPRYLPPGVYAPGSTRFLDRLAAANPATWVTTGHTHRHRRRRHGPVVVTEVGSIKDHPGTWAGYLVYEGGVVQTVRRVMAADALAWTERTRRAALGAWGRWSPGRLGDRSFSHSWPGR